MKGRSFAAAGVLTLAACAVAPLAAMASYDAASGQAGACSPSVAGVTSTTPGGVQQRYAAAGAQVTVSGANFAQSGCVVAAVNVGSATISGAAVTVDPGGSSLTFALPQGASGNVSVSSTDQSGNTTQSNGNDVFIETPAAALQDAAPAEGSTETVSGSGFAPYTHPGGVTGARIAGTYTGCGSAQTPTAATPTNDSSLTLAVPRTYCDGQLVLHFIAPADSTKTVNCTAPASSTTYNCILIPIRAGTIDVAFTVGAASPAAGTGVPSGSVINVTGTGFSPSGYAYFGGVQTAASWSDTRVAVTVPGGVSSGELTLQRGADLQVARLGAWAVLPKAWGSASASPTKGAAAAAAVHAAAPPPRAQLAAAATPTPGAVHPSTSHRTVPAAFRIVVARRTFRPGARVAFVVRFVLNGKPVAGALVRLAVVLSPGKGAHVVPKLHRTNRFGALRGVLVLSRVPGRTCLRAVSGKQHRVVCITSAVAPRPKPEQGLPFGLSGSHPVSAWLATGSVALVALAILVNMNVLGSAVFSRTVGRIVRRRVTRT